ncbi:hypothetical protein BC826DRAFT_715429 [Russula brevipes]|nr:hypothetical protein BC826DRAFT_715429 [Russula brevipes]
MQPPPRSRSRASTSSDSSTESSSSEDAPLASLLPPQRPGSAMSRASGSPVRRPAKPLIDIEQLLGENSTLPPRISEPSSDSSQHASQADQSTARHRRISLGLGERLALATGLGGLQASRPKSPESPPSDSKDEAFTPPEAPETSPSSPSPIHSPRSSPALQTKAASPALKPRANKSASALRLKPPRAPKVDTLSLKLDSSGPPPPSSSTSSDAPIPYVTPTPIRERHEPPAFAVTSRPTSHASNLSLGTLAAPDKVVVDTDSRPGPRRATPGIADQPKQDQQQLRRQLQEEPQTLCASFAVSRRRFPEKSRSLFLVLSRVRARRLRE